MEDISIKRRKHPIQTLFGVILIAVLVGLAISLANNKNLQWQMVGQYLFNPHILSGVGVTIILTAICQILATAIGVLIAIMKLSRGRVLVNVADGYIWFFRGAPLLVQLIFWYNLAALFPYVFLGIPFTNFGEVFSTNALISGFTAAIIGFSLHDGAYMAEIVRAGIISVDRGQREAALSTGMTDWLLMRRVVLPQAMRVIVPPTGNQSINLLKATSLVAFISGGDLLSNARDIYSVNFAVMPLLIVVTIWYLVLVSVATLAQSYIEREINKGYIRRNEKNVTKKVPIENVGEKT